MNHSTHQDFITFLWAQENLIQMSEMKISDAAKRAAELEVHRTWYRGGCCPDGYHVQQLLDSETEKLRGCLRALESKATLLVQEYDIDNNWKDHPEIVEARKLLGL